MWHVCIKYLLLPQGTLMVHEYLTSFPVYVKLKPDSASFSKTVVATYMSASIEQRTSTMNCQIYQHLSMEGGVIFNLKYNYCNYIQETVSVLLKVEKNHGREVYFCYIP
jgi:hypothetical protein